MQKVKLLLYYLLAFLIFICIYYTVFLFIDASIQIKQAQYISANLESRSVAPGEKCVVAGCSGQLCLTENQADKFGVTTCEFREEYACYRLTKCEKQKDGSCGWKNNPEFESCLNRIQFVNKVKN